MLEKARFLLFGIATAALLSLSLTDSKSLGDDGWPNTSVARGIMSQLQALKYGDTCSWEAEQSRQNYTRGRVPGDTTSLKQFITKVVENGWELCSAPELFVCDEESQKCVCGDPGYESRFGVERDLYTLEWNGKCRWNTNSYCIPSDLLASSDKLFGLKVDASCRSGTSCTARDGQACSKEGMIRYLFSNYDREFLTIHENIYKAMASGEVCSCKQVQEGQGYQGQSAGYDTLSQNENSVYLGRGRRSAPSDDLDLDSFVEYVVAASVAHD